MILYQEKEYNRTMVMTFGSLTLNGIKNKKAELNNEALDYLFRKSTNRFRNNENDVVNVERTIALENLEKLITELQTKRLRYNARLTCDYFTL